MKINKSRTTQRIRQRSGAFPPLQERETNWHKQINLRSRGPNPPKLLHSFAGQCPWEMACRKGQNVRLLPFMANPGLFPRDFTRSCKSAAILDTVSRGSAGLLPLLTPLLLPWEPINITTSLHSPGVRIFKAWIASPVLIFGSSMV